MVKQGCDKDGELGLGTGALRGGELNEAGGAMLYLQCRQSCHHLYRLQGDGDDLGEEAEDVLGFVGAVGVASSPS